MNAVLRPLKSLIADFGPMFGWMAMIRVVSSLGFAMTMPFLSIYLHEELGIPMTRIGLMLTIAGLVGSTASTIGGAASDLFGRKRLLVQLLAIRCGMFILMGWLVWDKSSFWIFSAAYIIAGVFGTSILPLMDALVADVTTRENRKEAYGAMRVAVNLGWAIGPAIGGLVVLAGYYWLFLFTAAALAISTVVASRRLKETWEQPPSNEPRKLKFRTLLTDRKLIGFLCVCLILFMVRGQLISPLSMHASSNLGLSKSQIGMLFFINGIMIVLFQVPVARFLNRFDPINLMAVAGVTYGAGYYLVGLAHTIWSLAPAVAMVTLGELIEGPTAISYVAQLAPKELIGTYLGGFALVMHLGWTMGPLVGGALLDYMATPAAAWSVITILALIAALGFLIMRDGQSMKVRE